MEEGVLTKALLEERFFRRAPPSTKVFTSVTCATGMEVISDKEFSDESDGFDIGMSVHRGFGFESFLTHA